MIKLSAKHCGTKFQTSKPIGRHKIACNANNEQITWSLIKANWGATLRWWPLENCCEWELDQEPETPRVQQKDPVPGLVRDITFVAFG